LGSRIFKSVSVDYLLNLGGNKMKTIESAKLLVRGWNDNDAAGIFELKRESAGFINYLKIGNLDEALDCIKIWKEFQEMYPVVLKETGKIIGVAGFVDVNRYKAYRELEVNICEKYSSAEYLTQAHRLMLDYGFSELGLEAAFSLCGSGETALRQALLETGFVYEGTLRKFGRDMSDRMRYSVIREEYFGL
jgi:RimJ/RimL family protein N-acetyltransferase